MVKQNDTAESRTRLGTHRLGFLSSLNTSILKFSLKNIFNKHSQQFVTVIYLRKEKIHKGVFLRCSVSLEKTILNKCKCEKHKLYYL